MTTWDDAPFPDCGASPVHRRERIHAPRCVMPAGNHLARVRSRPYDPPHAVPARAASCTSGAYEDPARPASASCSGSGRSRKDSTPKAAKKVSVVTKV